MIILAKKENGMGSNFVLVKYSDEFYAHGTEAYINDKYGFPVNSCGTKEEVLAHCISITKMCKSNIQKYNKAMQKDKSQGWKFLIDQEQKKLEALTEFARILTV